MISELRRRARHEKMDHPLRLRRERRLLQRERIRRYATREIREQRSERDLADADAAFAEKVPAGDGRFVIRDS